MTMHPDDEDMENEDDIAERTQNARRITQQSERRREDEYGEPVRQDWRSARAGRPRRAQALPSSRQEFAIWMQRGGYRLVVVVAAVILVLLIILVMWRTSRSMSTTANTTPVSEVGGSSLQEQAGSLQPSVTPAAIPTPAPSSAEGAQLRVSGTETEGLFLRPQPSSDGAPITTLPEGTVVTVIGADQIGADRTWKNVRAPDGQEGWVAADFLQPAQ